MLDQLPSLDRSRVHFTGPLPLADYRRVLQASDAHIYLTVPFVLSWSLLEAMAVGCPVVGSDTAPVREVIRTGETGLLANFFDSDEIARCVSHLLDHRGDATVLGQAARAYVGEHYGLGRLLPKHFALASEIMDAPAVASASSAIA